MFLSSLFDPYDKYMAMIDEEEDYREKAELAYAIHAMYYASSCGCFCSHKKRMEKAKKFLDLHHEYIQYC
jgi:hypothetical protein